MRGLIAILALAVLSAATLPQKPQPNAAKHYTEPQPDLRGTEQSPLFVKVAPSPNPEEHPQEKASERPEPAPENPWGSRWEGVTALATVALAIVTGGLWLYTYKLWEAASGQIADTRRAIRHARRSADAAERAAEAARDSVVVAQRTARRELRAYLGAVVGAEPAPMIRIGPPASQQVVVHIHNHGQTPAYDMQGWIIIEPQAADQADDRDMLWDRPFESSQIINPGQSGVIRAPSVAWAAALDRNLSLFAFGRIKFVDVFKKERSVRFRFIAKTPEDIRAGDFVADHRGNEAD